jgi:hypothetical protein
MLRPAYPITSFILLESSDNCPEPWISREIPNDKARTSYISASIHTSNATCSFIITLHLFRFNSAFIQVQ